MQALLIKERRWINNRENLNLRASALALLIGITSLFVLFVGILRILHGSLTVGKLMVFLSYLNSIFDPIREISKFTGRIANSAAALERIEEIARLNPLEIGAVELPRAKEARSFRENIAWVEGCDLRLSARTGGAAELQPGYLVRPKSGFCGRIRKRKIHRPSIVDAAL